MEITVDVWQKTKTTRTKSGYWCSILQTVTLTDEDLEQLALQKVKDENWNFDEEAEHWANVTETRIN